MAITKIERRNRIRMRIKKRLSGNSGSPRLSVFRSNKDIYVQIVDDTKGNTLVAASSRDKALADKKVNKTEQAKLVGGAIAEKAIAAGITAVVFDRGDIFTTDVLKHLLKQLVKQDLSFN